MLKSVIFDPFEKSPIKTIWSKSCVAGDLHGVIKYAKFQIEIHKGYDISGGVSDFLVSLLIFGWVLQQCTFNAQPGYPS